jgi:hypothetical protein
MVRLLIRRSRAVQRGHGLLLLALDRHEAHRGPAGRLADRFGINPVALAALHERFDVGRRDQPRLVAKLCDLPRPVMRRAAGLHRHRARLELREEGHNLAALELLAQNAPAPLIGAVRLKNLLGQIGGVCLVMQIQHSCDQ